MNSTIAHPIIHLNGNSKKALSEQYLEALRKLDNALDAMRGIDFHPRDYYVKGDEYFHQARAEREDAFKALKQTMNYVELNLAAILTQ